MEFVDGQSVKEYLRIEKTLPAEEVLDIAIQTAKALEFERAADLRDAISYLKRRELGVA